MRVQLLIVCFEATSATPLKPLKPRPSYWAALSGQEAFFQIASGNRTFYIDLE